MSDKSPSWLAARHAERRPILLARGRIQAALRGYLAQACFTEVDTPALQISPGNEAHLHAFATDAIGNNGVSERMYLHTSPEFAMKKLLAAGETRIHTFAHVWRNRERGPLHSPEFTLLEWYRVGEDYTQLMIDCAAFLRRAARAASSTVFYHGAKSCDPFAAPERLSVTDAFARYAGIDLNATLHGSDAERRDLLATQATSLGIKHGPHDTWSDIFSFILTARIEPHLGLGRAVILDRYPVAEAALARPCPDDKRFAERFELYVCGVELANGFGELTDPHEQRRRFEAEMDEKERLYAERYPLDDAFLNALSHMPEASGIALGFDRLVMLATGAPHIDDVLWLPVAQPKET